MHSACTKHVQEIYMQLGQASWLPACTAAMQAASSQTLDVYDYNAKNYLCAWGGKSIHNMGCVCVCPGVVFVSHCFVKHAAWVIIYAPLGIICSKHDWVYECACVSACVHVHVYTYISGMFSESTERLHFRELVCTSTCFYYSLGCSYWGLILDIFILLGFVCESMGINTTLTVIEHTELWCDTVALVIAFRRWQLLHTSGYMAKKD